MGSIVRQFQWLAESSLVAICFLIAVNAIPLVGVLWFGWDAFTLLILYWIESGIVGVFNIFKIRRAEGAGTALTSTFRVGGRLVQVEGADSSALDATRGVLIGFFCLHYGIFWVVHGVFVFVLPIMANIASFSFLSGDAGASILPSLDVPGIGLATFALLISHFVSYWLNFIGRGEYLNVSPVAQMMQPYGRVVVLHLVVVLGGMVIFMVGQPVALLVLLVVVKTIVDIVLHVITHHRARPVAVVVA